MKTKVESFYDLVERDTEVSNWLAASRNNLTGIYEDNAVFEDLENVTGVDLENESHLTVIQSLQVKVAERISALNEIRERTRAYDGKG